ncbi:MAG: hypothetical protein ACK5NI_00610, partial [bacterium]
SVNCDLQSMKNGIMMDQVSASQSLSTKQSSNNASRSPMLSSVSPGYGKIHFIAASPYNSIKL